MASITERTKLILTSCLVLHPPINSVTNCVTAPTFSSRTLATPSTLRNSTFCLSSTVLTRLKRLCTESLKDDLLPVTTKVGLLKSNMALSPYTVRTAITNIYCYYIEHRHSVDKMFVNLLLKLCQNIQTLTQNDLHKRD